MLSALKTHYKAVFISVFALSFIAFIATKPLIYSKKILEHFPNSQYQSIDYQNGLLAIYDVESSGASPIKYDLNIPGIYIDMPVRSLLTARKKFDVTFDEPSLDADLRGLNLKTAKEIFQKTLSIFKSSFSDEIYRINSFIIDSYLDAGNIRLALSYEALPNGDFSAHIALDQYISTFNAYLNGQYLNSKNWALNASIPEIRLNTDHIELQRAAGNMSLQHNQFLYKHETIIHFGLLKSRELTLFNGQSIIVQSSDDSHDLIKLLGSLDAGTYQPLHIQINLSRTDKHIDELIIEAPNRAALHAAMSGIRDALVLIAQSRGHNTGEFKTDYNFVMNNVLQKDRRLGRKKEKSVHLQYYIQDLFHQPTAVLKEISGL